MANITAFQKSYPWASAPVIVGAPMGGGTASPAMAVAVSRAGGVGFVGGGYDMASVDTWLTEARDLLSTPSSHSSGRNDALASHDGLLPVGIGFLVFGVDMQRAVAAVQKHKPVAAWLFAAQELADYSAWASALRAASPGTQIWIQTGSVGDAVELARACGPDVLVCQGSDAGGHGLEKGAGVVSLVPEVSDALAEAGFGAIPLVATGGIADGRQVAACVVLGAVGAAMGTRFLACSESPVTKAYTELVVKARDGGQSTVRDKVFDDLNAKGNIWPGPYDARSLVNESWKDKKAGIGIEENRERHGKALKESDKGFGEKLRANAWAGTGVGLVKDVKPAGEIVEETRSKALQVLQELKARI